jgi:hypothetical protein
MDSAATPAKNSLFYIRRITGFILLLAMSITFFYSAYSKSGVEIMRNTAANAQTYNGGPQIPKWVPIFLAETHHSDNAFDAFQWSFIDLGISNAFLAGIIARVMVGLELMLGLFLLFHIYLSRFTYKAVIAILSFFIVYLIIVIIRQGNSGNCGCFGDNISMTPIQAIIKNIIMIAVTVLLMFLYPARPYKYQEYVLMALCLAAFALPFIANRLYPSTAPSPYKQPIDLSLLYKYDSTGNTPREDLRAGKHIIAFMSLTCPHCRKAAYLMQMIHHDHPDIPMYLVLSGPEGLQNDFFKDTRAADIPHLYYSHIQEFLKLAGNGVPAIYWVNNSNIEFRSDYYHTDATHIEDWLHSK